MKHIVSTAVAALLALPAYTQKQPAQKNFSVGSRNTFSIFSGDEATGKGIGAQIRYQPGSTINTEWYVDFITSKTDITGRNDYHIGWSLLFYPLRNNNFSTLLQPYLVAGHCFDKTDVFELNNERNRLSRISMATQAGLGTHINITPKFDCSLTAQYMLHFGKEIEVSKEGNKTLIQKSAVTGIDGHMLVTVSFNYKLFAL